MDLDNTRPVDLRWLRRLARSRQRNINARQAKKSGAGVQRNVAAALCKLNIPTGNIERAGINIERDPERNIAPGNPKRAGTRGNGRVSARRKRNIPSRYVERAGIGVQRNAKADRAPGYRVGAGPDCLPDPEGNRLAGNPERSRADCLGYPARNVPTSDGKRTRTDCFSYPERNIASGNAKGSG